MTRPAVITFYSYKGGVGRTLLAANMAVALARRGKTLLWDLDVEAPGMHRIRALRSEGAITQGFFDWLEAWQKDRGRKPGNSDLKKFSSAIRRTPFKDLALLPAHGDDADAAALYFAIDWRYWLEEDPIRGRDLFDALLDHLGNEGYRHVVLDSRTGLTDLGALIAGILPDATVLVGGYNPQNLYGLARTWKALKENGESIRSLRGDRVPPELILVASPIPHNYPDLRAAGQKQWADTFGIELNAIREIRYDPELPFSERLAITQPERDIASDYERLADTLCVFLDRREEEDLRAAEAIRARPDIFNFKDRASDPDRLAQGKRFEQRVADLLRLLGYTVEPEQLVDSNRVDLLASIASGVDTTTYLVECKDHKGSINKKTLETLKSWMDQPKARAMHARGMVVAKSFAPAAIAYGKEQGIRTLTPEDLERQLLDFGPYLKQLISVFEQSTLCDAYVTQKAQLGTDHQGKKPGKKHDKKTEREQDTQVIDNLVAYGIEWAGGRGNRLWVLLGDYGTGKTAFTEKLGYELAKRASVDSSAPVPLLINLREVPNKASLEDVLHEHWNRVTGQRKDPRLFLHLIAAGRLVLLLDSFDEMGIATAGRSVIEQFRGLVRVSGEAGENARGNRVLVTCREQFFKEHGEAVRAAAGSTDRMSELQTVALSFDGEIDALQRFTPAQIQEYLVKRLGAKEGRAAATFLREHYLAELADRPQLLDIIIKSLPRLKQEEAKGGHPITTGALYQAYTNEWLEDLKPRERQSNSEQLRTILELLAGVLWGRVGNSIHYGDLYSLYKDRKDLRGTLDPNQLDVELRTAAFLSRTPDGHYGFSHRSFLEYFLARRIERTTQVADGKEVHAGDLAGVLDTVRLSPEICSFVDDLIPRDGDARDALRAAIRAVLLAADGAARASRAARANALYLGYKLARAEMIAPVNAGAFVAALYEKLQHYVPDGAQLAGTDLSELSLAWITLRDADMRGMRAGRTNFTRARLDGAKLQDAILIEASLFRASLVGAHLEKANCGSAIASGADFSHAELQASIWVNARLDNANLDAADFSGANLSAARLAGSQGQPILDGARVIGATAPRATHLPYGLSKPPQSLAAALFSGMGRVISVAISPDGARLATGSSDNTARLWDAASGKVVQTFEGHKGRVWSVVISPDGARLATGSSDNTARLWDAATGKVVQTFEGHKDRVWSVAISPDGARLATGSEDNTARLWDAATGKVVQTFEGHKRSVMSVAISPDGARLATGSEDNTARLWDAATGKVVQTFEGHKRSVWSVAVSPDGARLATGSTDNTARLWDAATGKVVQTFEGHKGSVWSVAISPGGARLATGSSDDTARLWDAASGKVVQTFEGHQGWIRSVAISPDGARLATGSDDNTARMWDAATGKVVQIFEGHQGGVLSVAISPDGARLATGSDDHTTRLWDADTGKVVQTFEGHQDWIRSVAISPDGARLATGSDDHTARLWDAATGKVMQTFEGHKRRVWSVAISPDGARLATGSSDNTARLWDAATGKVVQTVEGHKGFVVSVAISPDGARLTTGSYDNTARLWDAATGKVVQTFEGHKGSVLTVAISPDGARLATGSSDNTARLWDAATGKVVQTFEGHTGWIRSVAISPDGARLATGSYDNTARLWDAATGQTLLLFGGGDEGRSGGWFSLDFRNDARGLWRGEGEGLARLTYRDPSETAKPAPWIPQDWYAEDLPELAAKD